MESHLDEGVDSKALCHRPDACFTRRADVRTRVVGGEVVLLDECEGLIHQLNHTASFVWRACTGNTSVQDIVRQLTEEFDVDEDAAAADVDGTIEQLRGLRLLCE